MFEVLAKMKDKEAAGHSLLNAAEDMDEQEQAKGLCIIWPRRDAPLSSIEVAGGQISLPGRLYTVRGCNWHGSSAAPARWGRAKTTGCSVLLSARPCVKQAEGALRSDMRQSRG